MKENKNNEFRSKVYTDRPAYADFEDEFMSNIVLPGGQTVGDFMKPQR